ncbi:MAG TPA: hypothetical protein VHC22_18615 [Pirellulales bacterium]|nr:hypothetical protein [Pirellulales bacterium]
MHRPAVGLIALVLLAGAAACKLLDIGSSAMASAFWRVGVIMGLLWLALPELLRVRGKFVWVLLAGAVGIIFLRPKLAPVVLVFCVIYAVIRSRSKAKP